MSDTVILSQEEVTSLARKANDADALAPMVQLLQQQLDKARGENLALIRWKNAGMKEPFPNEATTSGIALVDELTALRTEVGDLRREVTTASLAADAAERKAITHEIVRNASADCGKHYWCIVQKLKRQKKTWGDLADLIGEGGTVASWLFAAYEGEGSFGETVAEKAAKLNRQLNEAHAELDNVGISQARPCTRCFGGPCDPNCPESKAATLSLAERIVALIAEFRQENADLRNEAASGKLMLLRMNQRIDAWVDIAPPAIREWLRSVIVLRFIAEQRNMSFQLPGEMDGAMSEGCKELFRQQYKAVNELYEALRVKNSDPIHPDNWPGHPNPPDIDAGMKNA